MPYFFLVFFFLVFSLPDVLQTAAASLVNELEEYITESFVSFCFHFSSRPHNDTAV